MDSEALKIILDLQRQVTLYEQATNDLWVAIKARREDYKTYDLNHYVFNSIHESLNELLEENKALKEMQVVICFQNCIFDVLNTAGWMMPSARKRL